MRMVFHKIAYDPFNARLYVPVVRNSTISWLDTGMKFPLLLSSIFFRWKPSIYANGSERAINVFMRIHK
jgi:hypothetical protein